MKAILPILAALSLNLFGGEPVKPSYFSYAPAGFNESGQMLHKITVQTRAWTRGRVDLQYSRNLVQWYTIIFFLPPTQIDIKDNGSTEFIFSNSNFGMRETQPHVFFRHILDPDVDYDGDLLDVVSKTILTKIRRSDPETDKSLFLDYESLSTITRNPTSILHQMNGVTGIVAWNSRSNGKQFGGVAITPRHVLCSSHAAYSVGDLLYFVDRSNNVHVQEVINVARPHNSFSDGDYAVLLLDEALPEEIEPIKVLPIDAYTKFDSNRIINDVSNTYLSSIEAPTYVIYTNQEAEAIITRITAVDFWDFVDPDPNNANAQGYGQFSISSVVPDEIAAWRTNAGGGDSGNPLMLVFRRQLVLFGTFYTATTGPFYGSSRNLNDIARAVAELDPTYTMTDVDLNTVRVK